MIGRAAAIAAIAASAAVSVVLAFAADARPHRYAAAPAAIAPVPMSASCLPEAAADVDLGAAWLLVRAADPARAAFDRAVDRDPDCALGYWGQALARFDDAAAGSTPIVTVVEATIARAAASSKRANACPQ